MEVTTALLCDFAQVREGMLFISSGCVSRLWRPEVPAAMGVCLALVIEIDQIESERPHELHVYVTGEDGQRQATIDGGFQVDPAGLDPGENVLVPVTLDLRPLELPRAGPYDVRIYLDGQHRRTLRCRVAIGQAPEPGE